MNTLHSVRQARRPRFDPEKLPGRHGRAFDSPEPGSSRRFGRLSLLIALLLVAGAATVSAQQLPRTSGSITAGGSDCSVSTRCVTLNASGQAADSAAILVSGTWSSTLVVEIAIDPNGTWTAQPETFNLATGAASSAIAGNGYYVVPLRGSQAVRLRSSNHSSGTVVVAIGAAPASGAVAITQPLPLPSGAATAARQDTGNASLSSIDTKTPALGQALAAASVPVVLTAAQLSTLTPLGTIAATQSGTWTVQPGNTANTTPWLFSISQGGNTAAVNASSQLSVNCANCSGSGVSHQDNAGFTPGTTNFVPVGGQVDDTGTSAASENSAGAARMTAQRGLHTNLRNNSGTEVGTAGAPLRVDPTGSTTQPVSGTVTANAGSGTFTVDGSGVTQPISAAALPLPSGAATSAAQTTGNNSLASIDGKITAVNTGAVVVSSSALPSGASTLAEQQTQTTALQVIDNLPIGQGSTTSGQSGVLTQGAVTTASPSYTNAQTSPLSLTTAGALRTDSSATTQPVSGTVNAAQSGTWNVTNVSGTVSLPTGASTLAEQQSQTTALQLIDNIVSGSGVNVSQINGVAPTMGNGASGTGVQRVTIANDSTGVLAQVTDTRQATAANLNAQVVGNVAAGAADSGNPIKTGGKVIVAGEVLNSAGAHSLPTPTAAGNRVDTWHQPDGSIVVTNRELPRQDTTWNASTPAAALDVASGTAGTFEVDTSGGGCATLWIVPNLTGGRTYTQGNMTFEMSINGGQTWEAMSGSNGDFTWTSSPLFPANDYNNGGEAGWNFPVRNADRMRARLDTAILGTNGPSFNLSWRVNSGACQPFTIARQGDHLRLHMTAHGNIANDTVDASSDFPLKIGGTAYQGNSETINTLSNLPVVGHADRATALMTPYHEQRVVTSDKLKVGTVSAGGADCSVATRCVGPGPLEGMGSLIVNIPSSAWTATLVWEVSVDGSTDWVPAVGIETRSFTYATTFGTSCAGTCSGTWQFILQQGFRYFRVRASAFTSSPTIQIAATAQTGLFGLSFIEGDVANDGPDGGTRPVKIGGRAATGVPTAVADADRVNATYDVYGVPFERSDHPNRVSCSHDGIGNSLTELGTGGCTATSVASTESLYITDIIAQSTTGTGGQFILRSGTGTNCGTGTTSVLPSAASAIRLAYPANTAAPLLISLKTPIKVTADHGLCALAVATNTLVIQVLGFKAP